MSTPKIPSWCQVGSYIDAKDAMQTWCIAKVLQIDEEKEKVLVNFDGWPNSYNGWLSLSSSKVAPFRQNSATLPGHKRINLRQWTFSPQETQRLTQDIMELVRNDLQFDSAFQTTQFLRGVMFVHLECLLAHQIYQQIQDQRVVVDYLTACMRLIIKWLSLAPNLFSHWYNYLNDKSLMETDKNTALVCAWPQLIDMLKKLFAMDDKCSSFFLSYDYFPEDYEVSDKSSMSEKEFSKTLLYLINMFTKEGGFDSLIKIINFQQENIRVPFEFIEILPIYAITIFLSRDFLRTIFNQINQATLNRVENITEGEIKFLKFDTVKRVLNKINDMDRNEENPDVIEIAILNLALKFLTSSFLEKRIKGMNEINERVSDDQNDNFSDFRQQRHLSDQQMCDWIIDNNLLQLVLVQRPHIELTKRLTKIILFLASNNRFTVQHLDLLWNSSIDKHDSIIKATHNVIKEIASKLPMELNDFIFEKLQQIPMTQYTEEFMKMLKEFTINAIDQARAQNSKKNYGLDLLMQAMLDSSPIQNSKLATEHVGSILRICDFSRELPEYFNICIQQIQKDDSVPQMINLIIEILGSSHGTWPNAASTFCQDINIQDIVTESIQRYYQNYQGKVSDPKQHIGKYSHITQLRKRLSLLEYVFKQIGNEASINIEHIEKIWNCMVLNPLTPNDTDILLEWLQCGRIYRHVPFNFSLMSKVFSDFVANPEKNNFTNLSKIGYNTFRYFFVSINLFDNRINLKNLSISKRVHRDVIGLSQNFSIIFNANSDEVAKEAIQVQVTLFKRLSDQLMVQAQEIWHEMLTEVLDIIQSNTQSQQIVTRALQFIQSLRNEGQNDDVLDQNAGLMIHLKEQSENQYQKLFINRNGTIGYLRRKIAKLYNQPPNTVQLRIEKTIYGPSDDDLPLKSINFYFLNVIFTNDLVAELNSEEILSSYPNLIDELLNLVSIPDQPYTELAWNLLTSLPINPTLKSRLSELTESIEALLNCSSPHRLLYCLTIVKDLSSNDQWRQNFIQIGGVMHLLKLLVQDVKELNSGDAKIMLQCEIIQLLADMMVASEQIDVQSIITTLLDCIDNLCVTVTESKDVKLTIQAVKKLFQLAEAQDESQANQAIQNYPSLKQLLSNSLINCQNKALSQEVADLFKEQDQLQSILINQLEQLFEEALQENKQSEQYWELFSQCIAKQSQISYDKFVEPLIQTIEEHPGEKSAKDMDNVLWGSLTLLSAVLNNTQPNCSPEKLLELVLHNCLFEVPNQTSKTSNNRPKCKHSQTRKGAFQLLLQLCRNEDFVMGAIQYLKKHVMDPSWRTSRRPDWNNSPAALEKSDTGYVGMKNLGCTCYMNSIIQQLFLIDTFRNSILGSKVQGEENLSESILYQLQYIMAALKHCDKQYINPKAFCMAFKDWDGNSINVKEQMDVEEFFNTFMDKLEGQLEHPQMIREHFGGTQVTELIGKQNCIHRSERYEPYLTLPVQVKGKKSLTESLESFVEGEILEGENAYQCESCDTKVTALRRVCIKHLPNILIITLRRFEFDFDTMQRVKVNDYCEFPEDLDMEPYTQEGLTRMDLQREYENAIREGKETDIKVPDKLHPDAYYKYKLKGIVIHMGTADFGHYYSFIKDQNKDQWLEFNDTFIRDIDKEDIAAEAFGGEERWSWSNTFTSNQFQSLREKHRNAYLLLYERSGTYKPRSGDEENIAELNYNAEENSTELEMEMVRDENERYWRCRHNFSHEYFDFVISLDSINMLELHKFRLSFFMTILIRSKDHISMALLAISLQQKLRDNQDLSLWFLETLSYPPVLKELLLDAPSSEKRKLLTALAKQALEVTDKQSTLNILKRMLNCVNYAQKPLSRHYAQYYELLFAIVQKYPDLGNECKISKVLITTLWRKDIPSKFEATQHFEDATLGYSSNQMTQADKDDDYNYWFQSSGASLGYAIAVLANQSRNGFLSPSVEKDLVQKQCIEEILQWTDSKVAAQSIANLYFDISKDNIERQNQYLTQLFSNLQIKQYDNKKNYLRQLGVMIYRKDTLQQQRVDVCIKQLLVMMEKNKLYIRETQLCLDYIYKLASKSTEVQQTIQQNQQIFSWVQQWIQNSYLQPSASPYGQISEASMQSARKHTSIKLQRLNNMLQNIHEPVVWDSDEELPHVNPEDTIELMGYNQQSWERATVRAVIGDLMLLEYRGFNETQLKWVDRFSDDVAPEGRKIRSI